MSWLETARKIVDTVLDALPEDQVQDFLTEAAVRRANRAADLAEQAKFGGDPPTGG